jgi:hypothetical protein
VAVRELAQLKRRRRESESIPSESKPTADCRQSTREKAERFCCGGGGGGCSCWIWTGWVPLLILMFIALSDDVTMMIV